MPASARLLSAELTAASARGGVQFTGTRFIDAQTRRTVRGLTTVLHRQLPVAPHNTATCGCAARGADQRRRGVTQPGVRSRKYRRSLVGSASALRAFDHALKQSRCRGRGEREHGTLVDEQLQRIVSGGGGEQLDPCTVTLLAFLRARKWRPLCTQLVMRSRDWNFATAADLLCRDAAGGLVLVELKSTRREHSSSCYTAAAAAGTSAHTQHLVQLYCMWRVLTRECGVPVAHSAVVRVNRARAHCYPLVEPERLGAAGMSDADIARLFAQPKRV